MTPPRAATMETNSPVENTSPVSSAETFLNAVEMSGRIVVVTVSFEGSVVSCVPLIPVVVVLRVVA